MASPGIPEGTPPVTGGGGGRYDTTAQTFRGGVSAAKDISISASRDNKYFLVDGLANRFLE
jgi:hypothetical protein